MSGHNKWSTIKHKKGKADAARGRLFTKLIKELTVAARVGGGSIDNNPRLRTAVDTARANNMPSDNITRAIKKGTGELEGVSYEDVMYEGYGPEGVAIMVSCLTDNKNRTVSEIRRIFAKHNGKLAEVGAVGWMFKDVGRIVISGEGLHEDQVLEAALEAGADDVVNQGDAFEIITLPGMFDEVRTALLGKGYTVTEGGLSKVPTTSVRVEGRAAESLLKLMDAIEESDDVQNVWSNFDMDDSVLDSMA